MKEEFEGEETIQELAKGFLIETAKYIIIFGVVIGFVSYIQYDMQTCRVTENWTKHAIKDNKTALFYIEGYAQEIADRKLTIKCEININNIINKPVKYEEGIIQIGDIDEGVVEPNYNQSGKFYW